MRIFNLEDIKKVLLIGADKMSSIIELQGPFYLHSYLVMAQVLFVEPMRRLGLQDEYLRSDGYWS
jgi:hypothetical protein